PGILLEDRAGAEGRNGAVCGPVSMNRNRACGTFISMKRALAIITLLTALLAMIKLASRPSSPGEGKRLERRERTEDLGSRAPGGPLAALRDKYQGSSARVRELVERVADRFGNNALAIDRTDGVQGLMLLDRMDLEAVFLYEKHPREF